MANASEWSKRVAEWRSSGLSAPAYAAERGFAPSTLRWWASRLAGDAAEAGKAPGPTRFVRVERGSGVSAAMLVVEIGEARVLVPNGADPAALTTVFQALAARGAG